MKGAKMNATVNNADVAFSCDDILCNILLLVPPESIPSVILVSKRWLRFISSTYFRHIYMSHRRVESKLMGFFVCNNLYLRRPLDGARRPRSDPALKLLSTSREGDDYSGLLKPFGYFIDTYKGFLLCGRHPRSYFVWDPFSRENYKLPRPRVYFEDMCMAFMVEDCPADGSIHFKVIRALCDLRSEDTNYVTMEAYSSRTTTWSYSRVTCSSTILLSPWTMATVIGGVMHWFAAQGNIAIYHPNREEKHIALIKLPGLVDYEEQILGESSDGCLQYGKNTNSGFQIWVLEKGQAGSTSISSTNIKPNYGWSLRYELNFKTMWKKNPIVGVHVKETEVLSFLPQNSTSIFIRAESKIFIYDFETQRVKAIHYEGRGSSILWDFSKVVPYYIPIWPRSSLCHGGGA